MGAVPLSGAREAWGRWARERGRGLAASTIARWRATLQAALRHGATEMGVTAPTLPSVRNAAAERIAYLGTQREKRLLAAYSPWAKPVMVVLCETGLRTQEALRLDWRCVDWQRNVLIVEHTGTPGGPRTKTGRSRRVGMRPAVRDALHAIWQERGRPEDGPVFLSKRGKPYADRRQPAHQGAPHRLPQGRDRGVPRPRLAAPLRGVVPQARRQPARALPERRLVEHPHGATLRRLRAVRPRRPHAAHRRAARTAASLPRFCPETPATEGQTGPPAEGAGQRGS